MQNPHTLQILRLIKKTAVILMLLYHLNRPAGAAEVASLLGMNFKTARSALTSMQQAGLVARINYRTGYGLTESGRLLLLGSPVEIMCETGKNAPEQVKTAHVPSQHCKNLPEQVKTAHVPSQHCKNLPEQVKTDLFLRSQDGKNMPEQVKTAHVLSQNCKNMPEQVKTDLLLRSQDGKNMPEQVKTAHVPSITVNDLIINNKVIEQTKKEKRRAEKPRPLVEQVEKSQVSLEVEMASYQPDNESPPVPASPVEKQAQPEAAVLTELIISGITLNKRTRQLASLPHITPEYIRAHRLQLKAQGKEGKTGLLITILESGIPAPELNSAGHLKGCDCPECARPGFGSLICPICYTHPCRCEEETGPEEPGSSPVLSALLSAGMPDNRITRSLADHPAITPELVCASREELKASFCENDPGKLFLLLEKAAREYERQQG